MGQRGHPSVGEVVAGRYRIEGELGTGGMGAVYRVEHMHMAKAMALKLLRPEFSGVHEIAERFEREARSAARLDDPHIVRVTDFGRTEDGDLFLVMELIQGVSLAEKIRAEAPFTVGFATDIAAQILTALEHAHANEVIHRDLKPDNIMLVPRGSDYLVKILDFGLAKITDQDTTSDRPLTQAGVVFGTPKYMSPEQAGGEPVGPRSDLYAVGVLLYELLKGVPPFVGETAMQLLRGHLLEAPPPLDLVLFDPESSGEAEADAERADALNALVMKALAKQPDERFADATAFREALMPFVPLHRVSIANTFTDPAHSPTLQRLPTDSLWGAPRPRAVSTSSRSLAPSSGPPSLLGATALRSSILRGSIRLRGSVRPFVTSLATVSPRALLMGIVAMALIVASSWGLYALFRASPEERVQMALARGDFAEARAVVAEMRQQVPVPARVDLLSGHVAFAANEYEEAVEDYGVALSADGSVAGDPTLVQNARRLIATHEGTGYTLLRWIEKKGDRSAVPLLVELATENENPRIRRRALLGLKHQKSLDRVDAMGIMLRDLRATGDSACPLRKWYLEQILDLPGAASDPRVLDALKHERARTGPLPFGLSRVNRCVERLLAREIAARTNGNTKKP
ncbi:MAG: protein kinase [Deltaproteobacteria bacterium]|nr:protein kinase [Deltaproteobacteria bacterium]